MKLLMSSSSSSRSASGTRARCSSMSGRRPAFHESMNSLRIRSRSVVTEDLLQLVHATLAALVHVGQGDPQLVGDLVVGKLLDQAQFEDRAVVVVGELRDRAVDQLDGLVAGPVGV